MDFKFTENMSNKDIGRLKTGEQMKQSWILKKTRVEQLFSEINQNSFLKQMINNQKEAL